MQTLPTIHLNGTASVDLLGQYTAAALAIHDAIRVVRTTFPHARDYYPQGETAVTAAMDEHRQRLTALEAVQTEFVAIMDSIYAQQKGIK